MLRLVGKGCGGCGRRIVLGSFGVIFVCMRCISTDFIIIYYITCMRTHKSITQIHEYHQNYRHFSDLSIYTVIYNNLIRFMYQIL